MKSIIEVGATIALLISIVFFSSCASNDKNISWAQNLKTDDIVKIEAVRSPTNENERYKNYDQSEFARIVEIINAAKGRKVDEPEIPAGAAITFYVTLLDGTRHSFANVSKTYLAIDGIYYDANHDWLSEWQTSEQLNSKVPDDFIYELNSETSPQKKLYAPEKTPLLEISLSEQNIQAVQLTNSWHIVDENGDGFGYNADSFHPLQMPDGYDSVTLFLNNTDNEIEMNFSDKYPPQTISVQRWGAENVDTELQLGDLADFLDKGEPVEVTDNIISIGNDGRDYIYEVNATWPEGDSMYVFSTNSTHLHTQADQMTSEPVVNSVPVIKSIEFLDMNSQPLPVTAGWIGLQAETKINVIYEGEATRIDFYTTPSGTETIYMQKLIGIVDVLKEDRNGQLEWKVPDGFMGHIHVLVYNGDVARVSDMVNAIYE